MEMSVQQKIKSAGYFKKILLFCLPLMLTGVLQSLYNAADLVVVGRFEGDTALAAVGSTGQLTNLILNIFMGFAVGSGVCVAHSIGAKNYDDVKKTVHTSVCVALIGGAFVAVVGFFLAPQILTLTGIPDDVIDQASIYVRIIFLGSPGSIMYNYCAAMLRASGDAKRPLIIVSCAGVLNVILNIVLVAFVGIGIAGVAIGTIAAQYVSAVAILIYLSKTKGDMRFSIKEMRIHSGNLKKILLIGIPSGIQGSLFSISNVIIQSSINSFGSTVMAGRAASSNIEGFNYIAYHAFYDGVLTYVGQSVGAKRYGEIKKILFASFANIFMFAAVLVSVSMVFREQLLSIYITNNAEAIAEGVNSFIIMVPTYFLCGIMDMGTATMRSLGRSTSAAVITFFGVCVTRVLWVNTVFRLVRFPWIIYISFPLSWVLTASITFAIASVIIKKESKKLSIDPK